jgi:DNA-directed RNA polymerase specialized sigma subunit
MTSDEVNLCVEYAKKGNSKAMMKILQSIYPFIIDMCGKFIATGVMNRNDSLSIGIEAIQKAIFQYDKTQGQFNTFIVNGWLKHFVNQFARKEINHRNRNLAIPDGMDIPCTEQETQLDLAKLLSNIESSTDREILSRWLNGATFREIEVVMGINRMKANRSKEKSIGIIKRMMEIR